MGGGNGGITALDISGNKGQSVQGKGSQKERARHGTKSGFLCEKKDEVGHCGQEIQQQATLEK